MPITDSTLQQDIYVLENWLINHGISPGLAEALNWIGIAIAVVILALLANFIVKKILLAGITSVVKRSRTKWDDALVNRRVFTKLSHIAPALIIYYTAPIFGDFQEYLQRLSTVYMILVGLAVIYSFFNAVVDIYNRYEFSRQRPIKGYVQIGKIFLAVFVAIMTVSILMNRPAWPILSGLGAMTAIILLIFKDTILGLVASVQLTSNDMIRIGDWIEMPKYGVDGDVIDISLHTVKVQNWDKTISSIPAYHLISDSFKNWRGMAEAGGRRIKRAVNIDMNSIKLCTPEMLDRFEKYQLIRDYIKAKRREIHEYNVEHNVDTSELINGRNMTNVGTFRAYITAYLRSHPKVHQNLTFLIRQLKPTEHGLPIEIYVFTNDTVWAHYEAIQADIFDHILSVVPLFDLRVFQSPSGGDLQSLADTLPGPDRS